MEHTCHVPRGMHRMARAKWHKVHGLEHGLELAGRQELFGGHDRRELRAGGGQPNRSSLPGGRNCSAAITGESPVRETDSRIGRATASVPQTGQLCMLGKRTHG